MIGRSAGWLTGSTSSAPTRGIVALLALSALGACLACDLAPAPPTSTPTAWQTPTPALSPTAPTVVRSPSASATPSATATQTPTASATLTPTEPAEAPVAPTEWPPSATPTPRPIPTATPAAPGVAVYTGQVTLVSYPYRDFLRQEPDALYGGMLLRLDRAAYEAAAPRPAPQTYQTLVVENAYLRLTFLPELGGRLYSAVIKATQQEIFYHNPVIKPSRYGPLLPVEDNWWLAAGGMEWAWPVAEHGYAWGRPWSYALDSSPQSATITLRDGDATGGVRAEVRVTLVADRATFSVQPRLINASDHSLPVQFWLSAALAPGSPSIGPEARFIIPTSQVVVHSRGDTGWQLPGPGSPMPWPMVAGYDLRDYSQWADYLGFFIPFMPAGFIAVYNPVADVGVARLVAPGQVPGHKVFGFGPGFADRSYTDDNSQYVELWGGANATFGPEHDIQLAPGATLGWDESWWPLAGLGGLSFANQQVALHVMDGGRLRLVSAQPRPVILLLSANGAELARAELALNPARPVEWSMPAPGSPAPRIQVVAASGEVLADYQPWQLSGSSMP